jgi:hypothetical protein
MVPVCPRYDGCGIPAAADAGTGFIARNDGAW